MRKLLIATVLVIGYAALVAHLMQTVKIDDLIFVGWYIFGTLIVVGILRLMIITPTEVTLTGASYPITWLDYQIWAVAIATNYISQIVFLYAQHHQGQSLFDLRAVQMPNSVIYMLSGLGFAFFCWALISGITFANKEASAEDRRDCQKIVIIFATVILIFFSILGGKS